MEANYFTTLYCFLPYTDMNQTFIWHVFRSLREVGIRWHHVSNGKKTKDQLIFISFVLEINGSWANTTLKENYTDVTEFILLGLTDRADLQPVRFVVFLVIYLNTVICNMSMILLIRTDSKLQTPIYFFLSHLSFVDLCYATNITPQMLANLSSKKKKYHLLPWLLYTVWLFHFLGAHR